MPDAVNCTSPVAKLCASAVAGVTVIDFKARLELEVPHPVRTKQVSRNERRTRELNLAITILRLRGIRQRQPTRSIVFSSESPHDLWEFIPMHDVTST